MGFLFCCLFFEEAFYFGAVSFFFVNEKFIISVVWLDIDIAIPSPTNPTASLTDEEIYARLDELNKDIALDLSSSLTSDERDTVLMIVCGYNKATNQFGVGIKIDIEAIDEKPDKYIDLDTKLRNGVPSWANVMIGDTMYDGYEFNHGYDYVYNDFSDIYYPCAEDFCVIVLGVLFESIEVLREKY